MTSRQRLISMTDKQRHRVMVASIQLLPAQNGFVLRIERKLRGAAVVTDSLLEDIIAHVLGDRIPEAADDPTA